MDIEEVLLEAEEAMEKAVNHAKHNLGGLRTGRPSPALVENIKAEAYGGLTEIRQLGRVSVPEATQLQIKVFDKTVVGAVAKAIEKSTLGFNPMTDGDTIRINVPALSGDRRKQLVGEAKKYGEESKISVRNGRRDANKDIDTAGKDKSSGLSEDDVKSAKEEVQELTKKYEGIIDSLVDKKSEEILSV